MRTHGTGTDQNKDLGGRRAIAGFLLQMLRSVQLGLRVTANVTLRSGALSRTLLTLEPEGGGDLRVEEEALATVEQIKMRAVHRRWSSGEIGRKVIPDLLRSVTLRKPQRFRFTTDNASGLEDVMAFLAVRRGSTEGPPLRWNRKTIDEAGFESCLASTAGCASNDPNFVKLLREFEIVIVDRIDAEAEVEELLAPLLSPGQKASDKRHEITARLMDAAASGRTVSAGDLLALIGPDALLRLRHLRSLPAMLAKRTRADAQTLGYNVDFEARTTPVAPLGSMTVLTGESGQGKTWSLCQAALTATDGAANVVLVRAPDDFDAFAREINERVWLPVHDQSVSLQVMARRLAPRSRSAGEPWITIHVDDVQSRPLAEDLVRIDWSELGINLVASAQPRIAAILATAPGAVLIPARNFTSAELRRFLRARGRDAPLETMPDDVFELLLKPIHAAMFARMPPRSDWTGVSEYELFETYWKHATSQARAQPDHPGDAKRLAALAGTLLTPTPRYPWRLRDVAAAGLDDSALLRLESVGMLSRGAADEVRFGSDRMLNWAIAEHLVARAVDERWTAERTAREIAAAHPAYTEAFVEPLTRLSYVLMDALWLLLKEMTPVFVADLLQADVRRDGFRRTGEAAWSHNVGTLGPRALPTLELLAGRQTEFPEDDHSAQVVGRMIPGAIADIAVADLEAASATIGRLLVAGDEPCTDIALRAAREIGVPANIDVIWRIHLERQRAFENSSADPDDIDGRGRLLHRRDLSGAALRASVKLRSDWLDASLRSSDDLVSLGQLTWLLNDERLVRYSAAIDLWAAHRDRLLLRLPADDGALLEAIRRFGAVADRDRLNAAPLSEADWTGDRVLRSRARIDPGSAFEQIARRDAEHGWSAANWWMDELARVDVRRMSAAIRANAAKSDYPATEVALFYRFHPEFIDEATLDWLLDEFAISIAQLNREPAEETDPALGRVRHLLAIVLSLVEPWQFDRVAARAGTLLETELARFAIRRLGRTSRTRDTDGNDLELVLATMAGEGFDAVVAAELARKDAFGREDGYRAAHWSESFDIRAKLAITPEGTKADLDAYRTVLRMQALAIHMLDDQLEAMLRTGAPVYVNAAVMRSTGGRTTGSLRERVEALIATGDPEDLSAAAHLAGFLRERADAAPLLVPFLHQATPRSTRQSIIGTFRALSFYDPSILPIAVTMMDEGPDDERHFVASYLSHQGDSASRRVVLDRLARRDLGGLNTLHLDAVVLPLLEHDDSREAMLKLLSYSKNDPPIVSGSRHLRALAAQGDERAHEELLTAAYREPSGFRVSTATGIIYLQSVDPEEAYFAALRMLARSDSSDAMALMLRLDPDRAAPVLFERFRIGGAELRLDIARNLRLELKADQIVALLNMLAGSSDSSDIEMAAEIAGHMPPDLSMPWLEALVDADATGIREVARSSIRSRRREAASMIHLAAMVNSPKPRQWARLHVVVQGVDPAFLWAKDDPATIGRVLDDLPYEFTIEAEQLVSKRRKKVDDEAVRADPNR